MNPSKIIDLEIKRIHKGILEAIKSDNKELENELFLKRKTLLELQAKMSLKDEPKENEIGQHYVLKKGVEYIFKDGEFRKFNKFKEVLSYVYSGWFSFFCFGISIGIIIFNLIK